MSKIFKIAVFSLVLLAFVGLGYIIGRGGGALPEKNIQFSISVQPSGDYDIAINPVDVMCVKGDVLNFTITNTPIGGFDANIQYTVAGLPSGSYSFSANPVAAGTSTTLTVNTAAFQSNTVYNCTLTSHDI